MSTVCGINYHVCNNFIRKKCILDLQDYQQNVENRENTSKKTTESGDEPVTAVSSATGSHYLISPTVSDQFSGSVISGSHHKDSDSHATILQYIRDLLRETRQVSERKLVLTL